jgi:GT2 family glycosyltransferase
LARSVGIIILNWNQEKDTSDCLSSLAKIDYPNYEVILVDNGSTDGSPDRIKAKFPEITLIKNGVNLGFAEGNNVGIRHLLSKPFDYALLLNNDTVVEPNFLSGLVNAAEREKEAGILGPKIYYFDDPNKFWFAGGFISRLTGRPYHRGLNRIDSGQYDDIAEVDFITGCAMLIRRDVLEKLKGLDPDYFNSYEDADFSLRARALGYKLLYVPGSRIKHKFAQAMGGKFSPFYIYYRVRNSLIFLRKNRFSVLKMAYNFIANPLRMMLFTLLTANFKGTYAAALGLLDFVRGKHGKGSL